MKKVIMIIAAMFAMANFVNAQDTIVAKIDNKTETILCKITKITSMNVFYTEKGIGKSLSLKDVVSHSEFVNAQTSANKTTLLSTTKTLQLPLTAGDELIKASKHYFVGIDLILAGIGFALIPNVGNMATEGAKPFLLIGGFLSLSGSVILCESHIHLKNAGIIMNKNGVGISIPIK